MDRLNCLLQDDGPVTELILRVQSHTVDSKQKKKHK